MRVGVGVGRGRVGRLARARRRAHNEPDATLEALPTDDELLDWARAVLRAL